jgi:hypothetical protein
MKTKTVTVSEYVKNEGIISTARLVGRETFPNDVTKADHWKVTFSKIRCGVPKRLTVDYYMGIGHEGEAPKTEDVLDSLAMDAQAYWLDFDGFCDEFGYDKDSRKAEKIYNACRHNSARLERFCGDSFGLRRLMDCERL